MNEQRDKNAVFDKERKKTNRTALIAVAVAVVMILTFFAGFFVRGMTEPTLSEIWKIINQTSIYTEDMTDDELADTFVKTVLKEDRYAKYYSPEEYARILEEDKGRYSGVGVGISEDGEGNVLIAKVYLNSPAYKNGIKAGDVLIAGIKKGETDYTVFKDEVLEYNQDKEEKERITTLSVVNKFFAGYEIGDELKIKVLRGGVEMPPFTLKKEKYTVSYVEYRDKNSYYYFSTEEDGFKGRKSTDADKILDYLSDDTAYIKLYEFEGEAAKQFKQALEFMLAQGRTKLILDLRDNGGGLISVLEDIACYLINNNGLDKKIRLLNIKEKNAENRYLIANDYKDWLTDISVIANAGTASASECLIGALMDYGDRRARAGTQFAADRLVLTPKKDSEGNDIYRTYGKGIMQTTYSLPSGGALKLTTAEIFWPISYRSVQDNGVTSDIHETDENAIARANEVLH